MGYKTIAIARGKDQEELAKKLGAKHYIDSQSQSPIEGIVNIGKEDCGTKVILATVTNAKAMVSVIGGLSVNNKLIIKGAPNEPRGFYIPIANMATVNNGLV